MVVADASARMRLSVAKIPRRSTLYVPRRVATLSFRGHVDESAIELFLFLHLRTTSSHVRNIKEQVHSRDTANTVGSESYTIN